MMRAKITLCLLLCLGLLLAGCGYSSVTTGASPTATSAAATPTVATRLTPGGTGVTPTTVVPPQNTPGSGRVTVQTSASHYHQGDTIAVTISNLTAQAIFFANHQTNCSVVTLQFQNGLSWQSVALCKLMIVTKTQTLGAGKSLSVPLRAERSWAVGTYRIVFHYGNKTVMGTFQDAFSSLFQVS